MIAPLESRIDTMVEFIAALERAEIAFPHTFTRYQHYKRLAPPNDKGWAWALKLVFDPTRGGQTYLGQIWAALRLKYEMDAFSSDGASELKREPSVIENKRFVARYYCVMIPSGEDIKNVAMGNVGPDRIGD